MLAVQETKVQGEAETESMVRRFTSRYFACVSHAVGTSAGCVLFVRKLQGLDVQTVTSCLSGRLVVCDFSFRSVEWRVLCIYAPNSGDERAEFFVSIRQHLTTDRQIILLGDFNCVLTARDKTSKRPFRDGSTDLLFEHIVEFGLEDVAECLEGARSVQYTHFQGASHARLDRIYISVEMVPMCSNYSVLPVSFTDHCLVACRIGHKKRRNNFTWELWKLNEKVLKDENFSNVVKGQISKIEQGSQDTVLEMWELTKQATKIKAIERASCIRFEQNEKETSLRELLKTLTEQEGKQPGVYKDDIWQTKQKLEILDEERYHGALVRARAVQAIAGERPTKRALGLEKAHARRNHISQIDWNGETSEDNKHIERAFFEHYQSLFAFRSADIESFKREFLSNMPKLDDETKEWLQQPIALKEVEDAIDNLNPGKSPGPDGLSAAFYKEFKSEISPVLTVVFNESFKLKSLPPSYGTAHTVLIPKTEDVEKLKQVTSYRPISLTNVDYKIFMKILACRLQGVIHKIVGPHQTCGIRGRSICTNIHKARCVLECADAMHVGVAVLQLDLEKAFDCVSHEVLFCILDYINVGSVIKEGVALAYQNCTTRLVVNKALGAPINVQRSVRQGCPLSPLLFCIYIETLCLRILKDNEIRGFRVHESEVKVLAYADDIAVFCENKDSISKVVEITKRFSTITGSLVNWGKCLGFWHGEWQSTPDTFANVSWLTTPVKYLGAPLQFYKDSEPYWHEQTQETRAKADKWRGAYLSTFARATVCNLFFVSKLWYVMQVLHCSRTNVQKLHRVLAVFVWASNWERCSRTNLFRRIKDGGLGLAHLFVRQLVNRFLFLRDVSDPFLRTVCQVRLGRLLPDFVITTGYMHGGIFGFFKEVVGSVNFLSARFSKEYLSSVTRKNLYNDIVDTVFPVPMYRAMYSGGPGKDVFKRVKRMQIQPGVKSFFFRLHTDTLLVRTFMEQRGLFVPWGTECFRCKLPETIDHVFLHCCEGVYLWDVLQRTLRKDFPLNPHGIRFLAVDNEAGVPYDLVMVLGLHSIWRSRTARLYNDVDARFALQYFKESVGRFVEIIKSQELFPVWLPEMEQLTKLRLF